MSGAEDVFLTVVGRSVVDVPGGAQNPSELVSAILLVGFGACLLLCVLAFVHKTIPVQRAESFERISQWRGKVFGHRGCRIKGIPENSMASFKYALNNHLFGIEFDVHETKDGVAVVFHDFNVERLLVGTGKVADLTLAELQAMPYKDVDKAYADLRVPTLDDVMHFCKQNDLKALIEIKPATGTSTLVDSVCDSVSRFDMIDSSVVIAFSPIPLYQLSRREPSMALCYLFCDDYMSQIFSSIPLLPALADWLIMQLSVSPMMLRWLGVSMIGPDQQVLSRRMVQSFHDSHWHTYAWTVNDPHQQQFLTHLGVMIGTDSAPAASAISAPPS